jgi:hypothetical protein
VTRPGAPPMDGPRIDRWTAAAVPWWVPRLVLIVGWVGACVVAVAGDTLSCTAADPGVCGPAVTFAVAIVVLLATPVLLWWLPLAGCGTGMLSSGAAAGRRGRPVNVTADPQPLLEVGVGRPSCPGVALAC